MIISPSVLAADFSNLESELKKIAEATCEFVHLDVMDGHFVTNLTFGAPIIKALRAKSQLVFDVHLMMDNPIDYLDDFVEAGSDYITIHIESPQVQKIGVIKALEKIKAKNVKAGIAIQPNSEFKDFADYLAYCDIVLVMSVYAGYGGQGFIEDSLLKIKAIKQKLAELNHDCILSVDGGINNQTAQLCREAGANCLVSGSYLFSGDFNEKVASLK